MLKRTDTRFSHVKPGDTQVVSGGLRDFFFIVTWGLAKFMYEDKETLVEAGDVVHQRLRRDSPHRAVTVEGERDDICSVGQTMAAQDLCSNVRLARRVHHIQNVAAT